MSGYEEDFSAYENEEENEENEEEMKDEEYEQEEEEYGAGFKEQERLNVLRIGEEDISTRIEGGQLARIQEQIEKKNITTSQIFKGVLNRTKTAHNIPEYIYNMALTITDKLGTAIRFRNPQAILISLLAISNGKIDEKKLKEANKIAKIENISEPDIIRYCYFVIKYL